MAVGLQISDKRGSEPASERPAGASPAVTKSLRSHWIAALCGDGRSQVSGPQLSAQKPQSAGGSTRSGQTCYVQLEPNRLVMIRHRLFFQEHHLNTLESPNVPSIIFFFQANAKHHRCTHFHSFSYTVYFFAQRAEACKSLTRPLSLAEMDVMEATRPQNSM